MLNNTRIETAKPGPKPFKLSDEKGLYLLVQLSGHRSWRFKYRFGPHTKGTAGKLRKDGTPGKPPRAEKMLSLAPTLMCHSREPARSAMKPDSCSRMALILPLSGRPRNTRGGCCRSRPSKPSPRHG